MKKYIVFLVLFFQAYSMYAEGTCLDKNTEEEAFSCILSETGGDQLKMAPNNLYSSKTNLDTLKDSLDEKKSKIIQKYRYFSLMPGYVYAQGQSVESEKYIGDAYLNSLGMIDRSKVYNSLNYHFPVMNVVTYPGIMDEDVSGGPGFLVGIGDGAGPGEGQATLFGISFTYVDFSNDVGIGFFIGKIYDQSMHALPAYLDNPASQYFLYTYAEPWRKNLLADFSSADPATTFTIQNKLKLPSQSLTGEFNAFGVFATVKFETLSF